MGSAAYFYRNIAGNTNPVVQIKNDHVDDQGMAFSVVSDSDASAGTSAVKFATTSAANDQPVLEVTQAGTGVAFYMADGGIQHSSQVLEATNAGVAADLNSTVTILTTDAGGADVNNVSLADGVIGQTHIFTFKTETTAGDTIVITPATPVGFATVTFDAVGDSVTMVFDGVSWIIVGENASTIA